MALRRVSHSTARGLAAVQRRTIMGTAYGIAKKAVPRISETEAAALNSGTVGFDRVLFSGKPKLRDLAKYHPTLTASEKSFLDNEVNTVCGMIDDYKVVNTGDMPAEIWDFIRAKGFFGMIIPTSFGGKGFSAHGHSTVITRLATVSPTLAATVSVPNSLGPGELLLRYGTQEQKDYYLPRLARGEMIPCFGLTGATSGSDAASMRDVGTVVKENGVLGIRASFRKRYITLAPVAHVVGLAIMLKDPDGLLNGKGSEGITIALLKRGHKGLRLGDRHDPVGTSFLNGPVEGDNVFIPMTDLLGGQERAGFGWNMLMECLAEGRGISLPASSIAAAKKAAVGVGGYARIRKQFKVPIAEMEGVMEPLANIASSAYMMSAAQSLMNGILNAHEKPAVLTAVMKQQMTDRMRKVVNDSMDVLGGSAIMRGPRNFIASGYTAVPIGITVEGANILTRSLMIFGQGVTRSHPHLYDMIKTIQNGNDSQGFGRELGNLIGHATRNTIASFSSAFMRTRAAKVSASNLTEYYESQLQRLAANFAITVDLGLTMGGKLKVAEFLSGRFADIFSNLYLGYATLWFYEQHKHVAGTDTIAAFTLDRLLQEMQTSFQGIFKNFPIPGVGLTMRAITFPTGYPYKGPSDKQTAAASRLITTPSEVLKIISDNVYIPKDANNQVRMICDTLPKALEADQMLAAMKKQKRGPTEAEKKLIDEVEAAREIIIQVDVHKALGQEIGDKNFKHSARPALRDIHKTGDNYEIQLEPVPVPAKVSKARKA